MPLHSSLGKDTNDSTKSANIILNKIKATVKNKGLDLSFELIKTASKKVLLITIILSWISRDRIKALQEKRYAEYWANKS